MDFSYIDLFSGIGGFHIACLNNGGKCVAACDINPIARKIYQENYDIIPYDDIKTLKPIYNIDLLCAGFPCQTHSTLGDRKGMKDERGKLFYYLKDYIEKTKPKAFLLENVAGLVVNNKGKYFKFILNSLKKIGYTVSWNLLNSSNFGLPQNRLRVYIIGHLNKEFNFTKLLKYEKKVKLSTILDKKPSQHLYTHKFESHFLNKPIILQSGFILRARISNYTDKKLFSSDGITGTMTTVNTLHIYDENIKKERYLSNKELLKLQGFPLNFKFPDKFSKSNYFHYLGNSVSINVIDAIIKEMLNQKLI